MRDAIIIRHPRYLDYCVVSALHFLAVFLCPLFPVAMAAEPSSVAVGANIHLVRAAARSDTHAAPMALATANKHIAENAVRRHQALLVKNEAGLTVLKGITRTGEGAVVSGIALAPATKGLSLFYSLGAYVLSKSVDRQIEAYSIEAKRLLNQKLAYDIRAFEQQSPQRWATLKAEGNPDKIYQALRGRLCFLSRATPSLTFLRAAAFGCEVICERASATRLTRGLVPSVTQWLFKQIR